MARQRHLPRPPLRTDFEVRYLPVVGNVFRNPLLRLEPRALKVRTEFGDKLPEFPRPSFALIPAIECSK